MAAESSPAAEDDPPADDAAVPEAPATAAEDPEEPSREGSDAGAESLAAQPGEPAHEEINPDLLSAEPAAPISPPAPTTRTTVRDPGAYEAAMMAAYEEEYRPADNPGRLHVGARLLFANAGGDSDVGGRMGGAQVDVGQAFNRFGYALTASAWGGRILLDDRVAEMNGLFGLGPSITLGRTALQQRGLIDLRLGYDVMYGVVNQRTGDATIVAPQGGGSNVVLEQTENLMPHGPRAMLQLGLLSPVKRNYHHGVGIVFGYQGLVGSLRGELPFTHMLVTGVQWWMG